MHEVTCGVQFLSSPLTWSQGVFALAHVMLLDERHGK
jgi:hypothetical protein